MKFVALLAALPMASAFVPSAPASASLARGRTLSMSATPYGGYDFVEIQPAGVKFFPFSPNYWDPAGLSTGQPDEFKWRLQHGEIKNGRVAMLAVVDYLVKGVGIKFPFVFNGISTEDIPNGLAAFKGLPAFGWVQIFILCMLLDIGTDPNGGNYVPGKVPGNVQPETPLFKAPGDTGIRAKEINNGRLAMMAIWGIWAGELVTGGKQPLEVLGDVL